MRWKTKMVAIVLSLALGLGGVSLVLARRAEQGGLAGRPGLQAGEVIAVEAGGFTLQTALGQRVRVIAGERARYQSLTGRVSAVDLQVGGGAMVQGQWQGDGGLTAEVVTLMGGPNQPGVAAPAVSSARPAEKSEREEGASSANRIIRGKVATVDPAAGTLMVDTGGDEALRHLAQVATQHGLTLAAPQLAKAGQSPWTFATSPATRYQLAGGGSLTLVQIQVGDEVMVVGPVSGPHTGTAQVVTVLPAQGGVQ